jgi:hypothetical protein
MATSTKKNSVTKKMSDLEKEYKSVMKNSHLNYHFKIEEGDSFEKFSLLRDYQTTATPSSTLS